MPGLLRGVARTAAVAGTATAVSGRVRRRQDTRYAERDAQTAAARDQAYQQQTAPPGPAAQPVAPTTSTLDQLKTLGELKAQGVLTEAEFAAQKAKILAG
jgi:hypothetical protein